MVKKNVIGNNKPKNKDCEFVTFFFLQKIVCIESGATFFSFVESLISIMVSCVSRTVSLLLSWCHHWPSCSVKLNPWPLTSVRSLTHPPISGLMCSVHWELSTDILTEAPLSHSDRQAKTDQHGRDDFVKYYTVKYSAVLYILFCTVYSVFQ